MTNAFTILNAVRDNSKQRDAKKLLVMILATYSNSDALCYPGNRALADAMNKSERTVKRMLKELKADGELEILRPGVGRDPKRIISLKRYAVPKGDKAMTPLTTPKGDKAMTPLNGTAPLGKTARNSHREQPTNNHSPAHVEFVRLWCERYETVLGERYVFQGAKDGRHVKTLLASSGKTPAQLIEVAEAAWKRPSGFWCKQAASISGFNSRFNEIRQELKNGSDKRKTTAESGRSIGTANEGRASQYAGVGKVT